MLDEGRSKPDILTETGMTVRVSGVDFTVREGEVFVVMGLSGSGKSTLIRMINRLIEPSSGRIEIDRQSVGVANAKIIVAPTTDDGRSIIEFDATLN